MKSINYSYALLDDADNLSDAVLNKIYSWLPSGKRYMKTWEDRLDEVDAVTVSLVSRYFGKHDKVTVHDIACSNALTSVRMFERLASAASISMQASDFYDAIHVVRLLGIEFVFDAERNPLQMSIGRTGFSARRGPWRIMGMPAWNMASCRLHEARTVSLFHPRARRLAQENPSFRLERADFFNLPPQTYDIVRLANVIFSTNRTDAAAEIWKAVTKTVSNGGLLIIGAMKDYSFLLRQEDSFTEIARVGAGFAHTGLIDRAAVQAPPVPAQQPTGHPS